MYLSSILRYFKSKTPLRELEDMVLVIESYLCMVCSYLLELCYKIFFPT